MKLTPAECQALYKGLLAAFITKSKLDIILKAPPINMSLERVVTGGTLDEDFFELVLAANAEGWMDRFLEGLRAGDRVNPDLIALIDGFAGLRAPGDVQPHLELLLDGTPFVNQHSLRDVLRLMTGQHGPKVLQVTGDPASGKTYSRNLIAHVARSVDARFNFPLPFEATTTARDVIADLAEQMGLAAPPALADAPQDATAARRIVRSFAIAASALKEDWWLIFDGFDTKTVDDSVRMLMVSLAQAIGDGYLPRVRLFLLAWDPPISGVPYGRIEERGVRAIERDEVKDYLDDLVRQFAMPTGMNSTDDILMLCYEGWDTVPDPFKRAEGLTRRIQTIARAALDAKAGL